MKFSDEKDRRSWRQYVSAAISGLLASGANEGKALSSAVTLADRLLETEHRRRRKQETG